VTARSPRVARQRGGTSTPAGVPESGSDAAHLRALLGLLAVGVQAVASARRAVDPNSEDALRGLYITPDDFERLVSGGWPPVVAPPDELQERRAVIEVAIRSADGRLVRLAERFDLGPLDLVLLLVSLAPDLDARFERLYGYLNDDVTRRRATIGLALELCGEPTAVALARTRLDGGAPLVSSGLLLIEDPDRPFLTRSLRVPDRVSNHLLGDDDPPRELAPLLCDDPPELSFDAKALARAVEFGSGLVYVKDRPGSAGRSLAAGALSVLGMGSLNLDLGRLEQDAKPSEVALTLGREARLLGAGVIAGPIEALGDGPAAQLMLRALCELPTKVFLLGHQHWDPNTSQRVPLLTEAPLVSTQEAGRTWLASLGDEDVDPTAVADATAAFLLGPDQLVRAAASARQQAAYDGSPISRAHLRAGALSQNAAGLERLARRIVPSVSFDDLVLPTPTVRLLGELVGRVRHRGTVLDTWKMRPGSGRGRGVTALFAGESGTGKTMAAEVIADALGLELYTINLATVVDKYVGETEKNLERIFVEATGVNGVLLFDEADALFGKRSEVRDAHDRYANIEVAYLLQRIESFDGLAVLSTNLRANVDEAFLRRFDSVIDFPFPDVPQRKELWERCVGGDLRRAPDVDLDFLAGAFELSGGNIRSIALTAAYLAAASGEVLTMADLVRSVHREYRKLGRLSMRGEFGAWFEVIADEEDGALVDAPE
jgi:hypothetical protein